MSSTLSTQNLHTFLRRKYCFFPVAIALSPPVGRCDAAIGRPPRCSGMMFLLVLSGYSALSGAGGAGAGCAGAGAPGAPGMGAGASEGNTGDAVTGVGGGLRAARFSR